mmetsp:Transcript_30885/g.49593  ORF Transcript_30885/g.49593 Transcript_30885/m.49593 type:complete len:250 (+) Transcript_30885:344-1093(+)
MLNAPLLSLDGHRALELTSTLHLLLGFHLVRMVGPFRFTYVLLAVELSSERGALELGEEDVLAVGIPLAHSVLDAKLALDLAEPLEQSFPSLLEGLLRHCPGPVPLSCLTRIGYDVCPVGPEHFVVHAVELLLEPCPLLAVEDRLYAIVLEPRPGGRLDVGGIHVHHLGPASHAALGRGSGSTRRKSKGSRRTCDKGSSTICRQQESRSCSQQRGDRSRRSQQRSSQRPATRKRRLRHGHRAHHPPLEP